MPAPFSLATRPAVRLAFCTGIYVAQGVPFGFVTVALAAWLAGREAAGLAGGLD